MGIRVCWTFAGGAAVPEMVGEQRAAPGDPRLHGADRHTEHRRDLAVVEVGDVAEHDRGTEVIGQPGDRGVEGQPVRDRVDAPLGQVVDGLRYRAVVVDDVQHRPPVALAELVERRVAGDSVAHVPNDERPSNERSPLTMRIIASWAASSASCEVPTMRRHTAWTRS